MEWIDVQKGLPEDGKQVLVLVSGFFVTAEDLLCQKRSYRIFQGTFHRSFGWNVPYVPDNWIIKYWMQKPEDPKF